MEMVSKKKKSRKKFRMDFVLEKVEPIPGENNLFEIAMKPDPAIWEIVKENGKEAWYNKIDKILIPMEEFEKAVERLSGIPVGASSIEVQGIDKYILKSKKRIDKDLQEEPTD